MATGVRKEGTRAGVAHYSATCPTCNRVLLHAGASKDRATRAIKEHKASAHGRK